jgi:hypothetical protein
MFKEGRVVEIKDYGWDFRVVAIYEGVLCADYPAESDSEPEWRIRFFLGRRYWPEDWQWGAMRDVLLRAFNMTEHEFGEKCSYGNNTGFWITCTEVQFARFMIARNEAGITNGFMDLRAEYLRKNPPHAPQIDVSGR